MPSPFPGMDPYLEHPDVFPDLHDSLITYLREFVQSNLPPPYFAAIGRRAWIEVSQRFIGPDVDILRPRQDPPRGVALGGTSAVASRSSAMPRVVRVPHDERREPFVEIYVGQAGDKRLVTTIEILSLSNKTAGEHGRELYLRKQREVLDSNVNLVEIDLLRGGEHATAVPFNWAVAELGPLDYHVCAHRFDNLEDYFVYPIQLDERLPEIALPLLPGDPDVPLDLQAVFDRCYDAGPYRHEVRYLQDTPVPPLRPDRAEWAQRLLQAALNGE